MCLAEQAQNIRRNARRKECWVGLFSFEATRRTDHKSLLEMVRKVSEGNMERVINCMALGPETFVRFWEDGRKVNSPIDGPVWHSYKLAGLAQTYFISNVVLHLSPDIPYDAQHAWFPIGGTKETLGCCFVSLDGGAVEEFR